MAYLHCHNCEFSQDDFWDFSFGKYGYWRKWRYNPFSCFLSHITGKHGYVKPRRIKCDKWMVKELGWKRPNPHSWWLIWFEMKRVVKKLIHQKYWTYKSWKRAIKKNGGKWPACPKCGENKLDID